MKWVFILCLALTGCFSIPRIDDGLVRKDGQPRNEVPWFASKELMTVCSLGPFLLPPPPPLLSTLSVLAPKPVINSRAPEAAR